MTTRGQSRPPATAAASGRQPPEQVEAGLTLGLRPVHGAWQCFASVQQASSVVDQLVGCNAGTLTTRHPMPAQLQNLLIAMAGPEYRPALVYSGEPGDALGRLRQDGRWALQGIVQHMLLASQELQIISVSGHCAAVVGSRHAWASHGCSHLLQQCQVHLLQQHQQHQGLYLALHQPLVTSTSGDPHCPLHAVVTHYRGICRALGEPERTDLTFASPSLKSSAALLSAPSYHAPSAMHAHLVQQQLGLLPYLGSSQVDGSGAAAGGLHGASSLSHLGDMISAAAVTPSSLQDPVTGAASRSLLGGLVPYLPKQHAGLLDGPRRGLYPSSSAPSGEQLGGDWRRPYLGHPNSLLSVHGSAPGVRVSHFTSISQPGAGLGGAGAGAGALSREGGEGGVSLEESTLLYPPVGRTFDGHASTRGAAGALAGQSLTFRRSQPLQHGYQGQSQTDSIDTLSDFTFRQQRGPKVETTFNGRRVLMLSWLVFVCCTGVETCTVVHGKPFANHFSST
jgi:hypothetical protein